MTLTFNEFEFFNKSEQSIHLMYPIFHLIFKNFYIQQIQFFFTNLDDLYIYCIQFSIRFSGFCTFNKFNFFYYKSRWSVHLKYTIFHWIFKILYFHLNEFLNKARLFVLLMYTLFHWFFTIWYVLWFSF